MRAAPARPAISPMARKARAASASCGSSAAARPLAIRNSPRLPRALAMRSGKARGEQRPPALARARPARLPPPPRARSREACGEPARVLGARRAVAAKALEPLGEIDARRRRGRARSSSDGDLGRASRPALRARRRRPCARAAAAAARRRHRPALVGERAVGVERAEARSSARASASAGARRRIEEPRACAGRRRPRRRDRARGRRGRRARISGRRERRQRAVRRLLPEPVADAGLGAAGAAAPLVGVGARHAHGLQPRQAEVGLEARDARSARCR